MAARLVLIVLLIVFAGTNAEASTRYYVDISVEDAGSKDRIKGASIEFKSPDALVSAIEQWSRPGYYYADVTVDHNLRKQEIFQVSVRVKGYEPGTASLTLKNGDPTSQKIEFSLKRIILGQLVHVTVLRSDNDRPINEARVRIGFEAGNTGPDGKITLQVTDPGEKGTQLLELSQGFHESLTTPITIKRYDDDAKQQFITCRLKPRDNYSAPAGDCDAGKTEPYGPPAGPTALKLVIRVRDKSDRDKFDERRLKLDKADVTITRPTGESESTTSTSEGNAEFTLDPVRDASKNLTVKVVRSGYTDATAIVPGSALTPGTKPIPWTVDLDKRDVIGEVIADLRGKLAAKRQALIDACGNLGKLFTVVYEYRAACSVLSRGLTKFHEMEKAASLECLTVPSLRTQIQTFASTAGQKESLLKSKLDTANAIVCKTDADVKQLEALWTEIRSLAWEVHLNAGKAEGINNRLKSIIAKADTLHARFDKADSEIPVPLSEIPRKSRQMTADLKTHRDNVFTPAYNLVREKRGECNKAIEEAIAAIDGAAAGAGLSSDPRVRAFKTEVNATRFKNDKPCDEEGYKLTLDTDIQKMEDGQALVEKWVEDAKNVPLCNGQKAEDDLAAQAYASSLILRYATDSDIPGKIKYCKVASTGTPPAAPATVPTTKPGKTMNAFGIYPRELTLAPGELKEFQAYVIWSDGTVEDISNQSNVRWPKGRQFRSEKEGTYYLTVKAKLDMERTDTATIRVRAPLAIQGPAAAKVGEEVAVQAVLSSPKPGVKHKYTWSLNGEVLSGNEASRRVLIAREGNNTLRAAAWRWGANKWDQAAEASHLIYGQAVAPVQVSITGPDRVTVQDSPVNASFEAKLAPLSPTEQYFYRWGATGPGGRGPSTARPGCRRLPHGRPAPTRSRSTSGSTSTTPGSTWARRAAPLPSSRERPPAGVTRQNLPGAERRMDSRPFDRLRAVSFPNGLRGHNTGIEGIGITNRP